MGVQDQTHSVLKGIGDNKHNGLKNPWRHPPVQELTFCCIPHRHSSVLIYTCLFICNMYLTNKWVTLMTITQAAFSTLVLKSKANTCICLKSWQCLFWSQKESILAQAANRAIFFFFYLLSLWHRIVFIQRQAINFPMRFSKFGTNPFRNVDSVWIHSPFFPATCMCSLSENKMGLLNSNCTPSNKPNFVIKCHY